MSHLNDVLKNKYGVNLQGKPLFRVVRAGDQLEKRFGVYEDWYGKLFLRRVEGLRETKKYSYIPADVMVLERWLPPELCHMPEIPETRNGSYEPVFTFQDADGKPIPVVERAAHQIIYQLFHPVLPGHARELLATAEEKEIAQEIQYNTDVLEDQGRSWIGHRLHSKEAIIIP